MSKWDTRDIGNGLKATVVPPEFGDSRCRWFIFRDAGSDRKVLEQKYAASPEAAWAVIDKAKKKFT